MAREKARRPTSAWSATRSSPQPCSSPRNPLRHSLNRPSTRIPLRPTSLPPPAVPRRPFPPLSPSAIRLFTTLQAVTTSSPSSLSARFLIPLTLPCDASAATRRRTRTLGAPLLLAADAKAAQRCIAEGCEGGCTEPSKLLSNEPQASCRNSRSGKFPRRPCCSSIYLVLSPYLSPSFFLFALSAQKEPPTESTRTHTRVRTLLQCYLCDTAVYLPAVYAGSFSRRVLDFLHHPRVFSSSFISPSAFLAGVCWRIGISSRAAITRALSCSLRVASAYVSGEPNDGGVRATMCQREGYEGQGGKTGYIDFLFYRLEISKSRAEGLSLD